MLFTVIASFIIAILSGMGVGGGGLFVVFLALFSNLPQLTIQGINLLFFLFSSGSAVLLHVRRRHIFGRAVLTMALSGAIGSLLGTALASVLSPALLRRIFGGLLVVAGILSLKKQAKEKAISEKDNS